MRSPLENKTLHLHGWVRRVEVVYKGDFQLVEIDVGNLSDPRRGQSFKLTLGGDVNREILERWRVGYEVQIRVEIDEPPTPKP